MPALAHRDFRNFMLGSFVSNIGGMMQSTAIAYHLFHLTGRSTAVGAMGLVRVIPLLALGLFGGYIADQFDRRGVILWTQLFQAIMAGVLAYVAISGQATLVSLYTIVAINAALNSFAAPARQAMVPSLVPIEIFPNAASVNGIQWRLSEVLGPSLAGLAIASGGFFGLNGLSFCYAANAVSFTAVMLAVWLIPKRVVIRAENANSPTEVMRMIREGFDFVRSTHVLRNAMFIDFWATLLAGASALLPAFAAQVLHVGAREYGILTAASGVGALLASVALAWMRTIKNQGAWVIWMIAVYGVATILFGISPNFMMAALFLAITGAADMISTVLRQTIRQIATPDEMRGRMSSISMLFHMTGPQMGDFEAGVVADAAGTRFSVVLGGVGCMGVSAWYWFRRTALRSYEHVA
jgi:MFS family permease